MRPRRPPKYTPYARLSPRRQRNAFIKLRWKILGDAPAYGGKFTSHLVLEEPGRPVLFNQWFDFLFLGLDGRTIWNAEIITARRAFWDEIDRLAWDRATALMSDQEQEAEFRLEFDPVFQGGQKFYQMREREPRRYDAFGGLTFRQYEQKLKQEILQAEPSEIHESYRLDREYRYGIGLNMIVDAEEIDRRSIEKAIDRFYALGETSWTDEKPVPRERLPFETEEAAMSALKENQAGEPAA